MKVSWGDRNVKAIKNMVVIYELLYVNCCTKLPTKWIYYTRADDYQQSRLRIHSADVHETTACCLVNSTLYTVKNIGISTDILWRIFHILTQPVPYRFVSVNRRNNGARAHTAMWAGASLFLLCSYARPHFQRIFKGLGRQIGLHRLCGWTDWPLWRLAWVSRPQWRARRRRICPECQQWDSSCSSCSSSVTGSRRCAPPRHEFFSSTRWTRAVCRRPCTTTDSETPPPPPCDDRTPSATPAASTTSLCTREMHLSWAVSKINRSIDPKF